MSCICDYDYSESDFWRDQLKKITGIEHALTKKYSFWQNRQTSINGLISAYSKPLCSQEYDLALSNLSDQNISYWIVAEKEAINTKLDEIAAAHRARFASNNNAPAKKRNAKDSNTGGTATAIAVSAAVTSSFSGGGSYG